jgi:thiamine biosynthesis lipoprotein
MFVDNYNLSKIIYTVSQGAFDPTVMPLVNYWGFGYTEKAKFSEQDSFNIQNILKYVGFDKLEIDNGNIVKFNDSVQLDFSAIAKGYGVDMVSTFMKSQGIKDFYVEIGGEVYAEGLNPSGKIWRTGINIPSPKSGVQDVQEVIVVDNKGIATSGNYRNFFIEDGIIYSHTMNPITGYPERNNLLSATIISNQCSVSDGYATACMVLGFEKAKSMISRTEGIEGILIYSDKEGNMLTFDSTKQ